MTTIYGGDNELIEIPFPEEKFKNCIKELGIKNSENLTFQQKRLVFIAAISDFKKGKLFLDELAEIAEYLWESLSVSDQIKTDLGDVLYYCAELNYYVRHCADKVSAGTFVSFMTGVMKYYEANKALIIK